DEGIDARDRNSYLGRRLWEGRLGTIVAICTEAGNGLSLVAADGRRRKLCGGSFAGTRKLGFAESGQPNPDRMKRLAIACSGGVRSTTNLVSGLSHKGRLVMDPIGMDLGKRESQVAILTEDGELIDMRIRTDRHPLVEVFGRRPPAKILVEASTESEWVARCLEGLNHEVIVADPNYAPMYAQRTRRVKTDRRDAHALLHACKAGT